MSDSRKKYGWLPYAVPVLVFIVASMLYFAPQYKGKTLNMSDFIQYKGASAENDAHYAEYGEDPQWNSSMFSGMPSYMIDFKLDSWIIRHASKIPAKIMGEPAVLVFMAMLCFWLMCLTWRINPWVGLVAALAYGFSTYTILIIGAGHISKVWAMAFAPLLVGSIVYCYRGGNLWFGSAMAALFASLTISANHPQITYYFLFVILALAVNELIRAYKGKALKKFAKVSGMLALAAALAIGSNFGTLYYTAHHSSETTRGATELSRDGNTKDNGLDLQYITAWSYGIGESLNMLVPNLKGGSSAWAFERDGQVAQALSKYGAKSLATQLNGYGIGTYWGDQPWTAGPTYIGAVVFFLAVMAMFVLKGRSKWWILAVSIFALFISWGHNMMWFAELCFKYLPGYSKFRAVSTALVVLQWSMPLLAALLLAKLWKAETDRGRMLKGLKWSLAITGGTALILIIFGNVLFSFQTQYDIPVLTNLAAYSGFDEQGTRQFAYDISSAVSAERASMMRSDAWRSLVFIVLGAGVLYLFSKEKIRRGAMVAALAALVCIDLVAVNTRFLSWNDFVPKQKTEIKPTAADKLIMADGELGFRVANFTVNTFNDATTSFFHRSIGGYHGAKLQRYDDLIAYHLQPQGISKTDGVYNMLNTKYFIEFDQDGIPVARLNPDANGAAWFVDNVYLVENADEEIYALYEIDTKRDAVVDRRFESMLANEAVSVPGENDRIELTDYKVNRLTYEYSSAEDLIAVFSEIYYDKGWDAYVDGKPAEYFRTNYVLRGMVLPAGEHTVEFVFRAPNFAAVSAVTLISSLIILAGFTAGAVWIITRKRRRENGGGENEQRR